MYQTYSHLAGVEIPDKTQKIDGRFFRLSRAFLSAACVLACPIVVTVPLRGQEFSFEHVTIDANPPDRPWYKMLGDIDGDGDTDIVMGGIVWFSNPRIGGAGTQGDKSDR